MSFLKSQKWYLVICEFFNHCLGLAQFLYDELSYKHSRYRRPLTKEEEEDVAGEIVVITGGNRGIGKEIAMQFAEKGAIVVLGCRNMESAQTTIEEIRERTKNNKLEAFPLDLTDMDSVETFSKNVGAKYRKIKILVNNAGVPGVSCGDPKVLTKDGLNPVMAANHFGHFLLTNLLLQNLQKSKKPRIIVLTSIFQRLGASKLDLEDLTMEKSGFGFGNAFPYGNSKFCNSLFAKELGEEMKKEKSDLSVYSVCPSFVFSGMGDDSPSTYLISRLFWLLGIGSSCKQAVSEFIIPLALSSKLGQAESGLMYQYRKPCPRCNPALEERKEFRKNLWTISAQLVKLKERIRRRDLSEDNKSKIC